MKKLIEYMNEQEKLNEKLVTFGNKAYPNFNNVVILAGGAGSGKGFVLKNLIGLEGSVIDVDAVKELSLKSQKIRNSVLDKTGKDLKELSLKNSEDVRFLHTVLSNELNLIKRKDVARFSSILSADKNRKPNLIFDTTLSRLTKLREITETLIGIGYQKENIHIVWVINSYDIAKAQNRKRDRTVPEEVLLDTHRGSAQTAKDILEMGENITNYLDGDIWYVFNNLSSIRKSDLGGMVLDDTHTIKLKEKNKPINKDVLTDDVTSKIVNLIPKGDYWK